MNLTDFRHTSNPRLYRAALSRRLTVERMGGDHFGESVFSVSSASVKDRAYKVLVTIFGYSCPCQSTGACAHGALALATEYSSILDYYEAVVRRADDEKKVLG